ncbi:efflux transporter outer membrane subunit [Frateuria aurantia]
MKWSRWFVLGCWLPALAACGLFHPVGPDYRPPSPPPSLSLKNATEAAFSPQSPVDQWWQLYPDLAVRQLVQQALQKNLDLRVAAATLRQSQAALDEAMTQWLPSTNLSASVVRSRGNVYGSPYLKETSVLVAGLTVSYELDLFGRIRRTVEASQASRQAQEYAFVATQLQVAASTVQAYALACQSQAQLDVAQQSIAISQRLLDVTTRLARGGASSELDVTRAQAELASGQAAIAPLQAQHNGALYALAVLLGQPPEQPPEVAVSCHRPPVLNQVIPVGDGLALLRRRPDVNEAERDLQAASANIGVATAALYPTVSMGLGYGGEGTSVPGMFEASGRTWSAGPLLHWTIPNRRLAHAQIASAQAAMDAALARYDGVVLNALKETEGALDEYARALDHREALIRMRDADAKALSEARRLYRLGVSPYLDVLTAQQSLAAAQQQVALADGAVAADQVSVFLSLGGSWDSAAQQAADEAQRAAREQVRTELHEVGR